MAVLLFDDPKWVEKLNEHHDALLKAAKELKDFIKWVPGNVTAVTMDGSYDCVVVIGSPEDIKTSRIRPPERAMRKFPPLHVVESDEVN